MSSGTPRLISHEQGIGHAQMVEHMGTVAEDVTHTRDRVDELSNKMDALVDSNKQLLSMMEKIHAQMHAGTGVVMEPVSGSALPANTDEVDRAAASPTHKRTLGTIASALQSSDVPEAFPGLPLDVVATHILAPGNLPDPADLARLAR